MTLSQLAWDIHFVEHRGVVSLTVAQPCPLGHEQVSVQVRGWHFLLGHKGNLVGEALGSMAHNLFEGWTFDYILHSGLAGHGGGEKP